MKTVWYWHKYREVEQWNRIEDTDFNPQTYEHLIFEKGDKSKQWKKEAIFNKWCWQNWNSTCRRMKIDPCLSPYTKHKDKWIRDHNINLNTLNLIEEKVGNTQQQMGTGDHFLDITPAAKSLRATLKKWELL